MIPAVEASDPLESGSSRSDDVRPDLAGAQSGHASSIASQSIIIAVADAPAALEAPRAPAAPVDAGEEYELQAPAKPSNSIDRTLASPAPVLVSEFIEPVSPAVRYVAHRERSRRKQVTTAMMLLVAVIVLAIVLIWVLQRGQSQASAPHGDGGGLAASRGAATAAMQSAPSATAHHNRRVRTS